MKLRAVIILLALALVVWIGVRVKDTLATRADVEKSRAAKASEATSAEGQGASKRLIVRGKAEPWVPEVKLEGTVVPLRETDLAFKAGGRLSEIKAKIGDHVKQGALLGRLEAAEASAQQRAAAAQVKAAEVGLAIAEDDLARATKVLEKGVISEGTGVKARAARDLAAAQLEAAKAQLELATVNLENHALYAPFSGFITRAPTAPGQLVGPGVPMFHIQDVGTLKLSGSVGDEEGPLVTVGSKVELSVDGRTFEGKITAVLPSLDPATRRVPIEAQLPNDVADPIRTGGFVRAMIRGLAPIDVVRLPSAALVPGTRDRVVVVEGNVQRLRTARFALADGGDLLVRSGVAADESVLLSPTSNVRDGDAVEPELADAKADATAGAPKLEKTSAPGAEPAEKKEN
ncbi:efflux RND transporter periplasmic adaptor subunit [Myxococcota bacterium]|nr:efflux RND transporter periplasmic adaptor subunit [Myxococcota bacterium]